MYKENKYYKFFEIFELLCRFVSFKKQIILVILIFGNILSFNVLVGIISLELKELMIHVAKGIIGNSSALSESLISWLYERFRSLIIYIEEKNIRFWKNDFAASRNDFIFKVILKTFNSIFETYLRQEIYIVLFYDLFCKQFKYLLTEYENCVDLRCLLGPLLLQITHLFKLQNFNDKIILLWNISSILCLSIVPNVNMWISKYAKIILFQLKHTGFKKILVQMCKNMLYLKNHNQYK
jgi:hypothetical protein